MTTNVNYKNILIVSIAATFYLYMFFIRVLPSVMIDALMIEFDANALEVGSIITAFVTAYAVGQIPAGILVDRYGPKYVLITGMMGCIIGNYIFQMSHHYSIAVLSRVILGLSCSPSFVAPIAMIKQHFPKKWFTPATGFVQVLGCIGAMLTTQLSHYVQKSGWEQAIIDSGMLACLLFTLYLCLPKDHVVEKTATRGSLSQSFSIMLYDKEYWLVGFLAFSSWAAIGGFSEAWGITYLSKLQQIPSSLASSQVLFTWVGIALSSPLVGLWSEHTQYKKYPLLFSYGCGALSTILLISGLFPNQYYLTCSLLFLMGLSAGAQPIAFKLISTIAPQHINATAVSFCNICVIGGAFILQPIISIILKLVWDGKMIDDIPYYSVSQLQISFIPIVIVLILAMLASLHTGNLRDEIS